MKTIQSLYLRRSYLKSLVLSSIQPRTKLTCPKILTFGNLTLLILSVKLLSKYPKTTIFTSSKTSILRKPLYMKAFKVIIWAKLRNSTVKNRYSRSKNQDIKRLSVGTLA